MAVTDADFAGQVAAGVVLVDVWAAWCAPCLTLTPVMERLAGAYRDRVRVLTLDADSNVETVVRYDVRALPTVLVFRDGALVARQSGAQAFGTYAALLDRVLDPGFESAPGPVADAGTHPAPANARDAAWAEAQALVASDRPAVLFKHSATCSISIAVKREYDAFTAEHPDVPTRVITVQNERPLSNALEELLRVLHESPQAIVVQRGEVLWHASHRRVTAAALTDVITSAGAGAISGAGSDTGSGTTPGAISG